MAGQKFNISFVIGAVDNLTTKVMQINDRVNKATAPLGKAKDAFGLLGAELGVNKFGVALGNLGTKGQKVFDEFLSAGAKIAGLGVAIGGGLAYVVKGASDSADAISDASNRIGISRGLFQTLQYASTQSGVSLQKLEPILTKFSANLGTLGDEGSGTQKIFRALGIGFKDAQGQLLPMDAILPKLADKLSSIQNPALRNKIAMELFGKEGVKFTQVLAGGSKGLTDFQKRAESLGLILGDDMINAGAKFNDKFDELSLTFTRLRDSIGAELFPVLSDLMQQIIEVFVANKPAIVEFAKAFAKDLPDTLKAVMNAFKGIAAILKPLVILFKAVSSVFGTTNTVIGILAVAITGKLILAIYALMGAFVQLGIVAAATPIGWIAIAIGLVIAAIAALIVYWEPIKGFFKSMNEGWQMFIAVLGFALGPIGMLVAAGVLVYRNWEPLLELFTSIAGAVSGAASKFAQFFGFGGATGAATGAGGAATGAAGVVQQAAQNASTMSKTESKVVVDFNNLPQGSRIRTEKAETPVDLNMGYSMAGA